MTNVTVDQLQALYKRAKSPDLPEDQREPLLAQYRELIDQLPVNFIGPTWRRTEDGKPFVPSRRETLGYQVALWIQEYVGGVGGARRFELTKEQLRFILWWYAIDEAGNFIYRTGVLQRCKGWGKDPMLAVLCLVEFVGPCRFSHFDEDGYPVAVPYPDAWIQIAAVSQDQTKNTAAFFPSFISKQMQQEYGIKPGKQLWRADNGRKRMELVTSNPATIEGGRPSFLVLNETHHWTKGSGGHGMYLTIDGNATKVKGRYLAITNAYVPGEDSVAERMRDAWQKIQDGMAYDIGFLYDSIEPDPRAPMTPEAMEIILPKVRGDAVWLPVKETIQSALNAARPISQSRRMYYNQIVADEDAIFSEAEWRACEDRDLELARGDEITLGFDGSLTRDATALVALRVRDLLAVPVKVWEPDGDDWQINRAEVDSAVAEAFRKYKVVGFYADVNHWESNVLDWHEAYGGRLKVHAKPSGNSVAWDMRQAARATMAHERLVQAIFDAKLRHNGDPDLRRHVLNARRRVNNHGLHFGKESAGSPRKVDAYAALLLAYEAYHDYKTKRLPDGKRGGRVWI